jgi:hypothetical protein
MGEEKLSWRTLHTAWLLLALIFGGIAFFVIKQGGVGFNTAIVYALSAGIIAELIYLGQLKPPNLYAMLVGALLACFPVIVAASSFDATAAIWLEVVGIIGVWVLNSQESFGERDDRAPFLAIIPMGVWAFWGFIFLYEHLSGTATLTWQSGIYHLGILLFAAFSTLRFLGAVKDDDKTQKWTIYLLALAVFGMVLITNLGQALSFG